MSRVRWTTTVLDCDDPQSLAQFWADLLGVRAERITDDFHVVPSGTAWLAAQRIVDHEPPTWPTGDRPKQIHLDVAVEDLDETVIEAVRLGASEEPEQQSRDRWRVMRDPAGHLFCLSHHIQDYLPVEFGD